MAHLTRSIPNIFLKVPLNTTVTGALKRILSCSPALSIAKPVRNPTFSALLNTRASANRFVDRTEFIRSSWDQGCTDPFYIVAPSRFGKSINMSMLENFFQVQLDSEGKKMVNYKDTVNYKLFSEGGAFLQQLKIMDHKQFVAKQLVAEHKQFVAKHHEQFVADYEQFVAEQEQFVAEQEQFVAKHMAQYPVVSFNFSQVSVSDMENFRKTLSDAIVTALLKFKIEAHDGEAIKPYLTYAEDLSVLGDNYFLRCGSIVLEYLYDKYGSKCIVLIDEFSRIPQAFLEKFISTSQSTTSTSSGDVDNAIIELYGLFLASFLKGNIYLKASFLFGIIRFGSGVATHCNNIHVEFFSNNKTLAQNFGLTKDQVRSLLEKNPCPLTLESLEENFNGYTVGGDEQQTVFATDPVLKSIEYGVLYDEWVPGINQEIVKGAFSYGHPIGCDVLRLIFGTLEAIKFEQKPKLQLTSLSTLKRQIKHLQDGVCGVDPSCNLQLPRSSMVDMRDELTQYLYELGYFTKKRSEGRNIHVAIPNVQVRLLLERWVRENCRAKWTSNTDDIETLCDTFKNLDNTQESVDNFASALAKFFSPFSKMIRGEATFEGLFFSYLCCYIELKHQLRQGAKATGDLRKLDFYALFKEVKKAVVVENKYNRSSKHAVKDALLNNRHLILEKLDSSEGFSKMILGINYGKNKGKDKDKKICENMDVISVSLLYRKSEENFDKSNISDDKDHIIGLISSAEILLGNE